MTDWDPQRDAYARGEAAGQIAERLASHDRHFAAINGSLEKIGAALHGLEKAVQRLADQATAREVTVVTTAAAIKAAKDADDRKWSPLARWGAAATVTGGVLAVVAWVLRARGVA
jgi:hypothetical protein